MARVKQDTLVRSVARAKKANQTYGEFMASQYMLRQAAEFALHKSEFNEANEQKEGR